MGKLLTIIALVRTFEYRRHKRPFARIIKDLRDDFNSEYGYACGEKYLNESCLERKI